MKRKGENTMGILSTVGAVLVSAALVGAGIASQEGVSTTEKIVNYNNKVNKEIEKKQKKMNK